jgi:heat shock protein HslJ
MNRQIKMKILNDVRRGMILLAVVVLMAPIAAFPAATGPEGASWRLVEVAGRPASLPAGQKQPFLMLDADQKKATGFGGCNSFFGGYTLSGPALAFGPLGSTRMACPDQESGLESAFLDALARTREWKIEDSALLLLSSDGVLARFLRGTADAARPDPAFMTYHMRSVQTGTVTLSRGEFRAPAAAGSAVQTVVTLTDKQAFGKVKGREAGAVVLVASTGGTGSFYELALLLKGAEGWSNTDTVLLGDRVLVRDLVIEDAHIVLWILDHGPGDALCCPTRRTTKHFGVRNDRLVPED